MTDDERWPLFPGVSPGVVDEFVADAWPAHASDTRTLEISGRHALLEYDVAPEFLRPGGYISGPTQFGLADRAFWYACFGAIGLEPMAVTIELSIRFLRPAFGDRLMARAELASVSRRTIAGSVTVWTDDEAKPTSICQGTYARPPAPDA